MIDTPHAELSKVARMKGKATKSWKSIKAKLKSALPAKRPIQVVSPPQKQVGTGPFPNELVQVVPSLQAADTPTHLEDNPVCTSLPGLSGLCKLEDDPIDGVDNHPETVPQLQGTVLNNSIRSDIAVSGEAESDPDDDSIVIVQNQTPTSPFNIHVQEASDSSTNTQETHIQPILAQNSPVQAAPFQITPAQNLPAQVQLPSVNQIGRGVEMANIAFRTPVFTPTLPSGTPARPPGLIIPPVTPYRQLIPLDPQNAQRKITANPFNPFPSPSPVMVIPALGAPPSPKQTIPNTPYIPPAPFKDQVGPAPNIIAGPPFLPRSPRPRVQHNLGSVQNAGGKQRNFGVIGDRRVGNNEPQSHIAEKPPNELQNKEKVGSAPTSDGANSTLNRDGLPSGPLYTYPKPIHVGWERYYVGRYLGGGAAGKVYSALNKKSLKIHALKVIKRKDLRFDDLSMVKEELTIMRTISETKYFGSQPNGALSFVNHLLESWYDKDCIYFVMPLCVDSLYEHLRRFKLDPLTIRVYAAELMCGLEALHDMRVVHCDLKPDNILVSPDGHLTISDFGLSISWLDPRYHHYPSHAFRCRRLAGTDGYMAPEIVSAVLDPNMPRRGNFGFAADIWSLGLIFAELGMGGRRFVSLDDEGEGPRWEGDFKRFARTMMLSPEMLAKRIEENLRDDHARLVERMLQIGEAYRANFDEIASHPFFSQLDMAKVIDKGYTVPIPPLEKVLPCRHTNVDEVWFQKHTHPNGGGEPLPEGLGNNAKRALCLTQDIDRYIIPEDFVWDIEGEIKRVALRSMQQAAAQNQA